MQNRLWKKKLLGLVVAELPLAYAERVRFVPDAGAVRVTVDGTDVVHMSEIGGQLVLEPILWAFKLGSRAREDQLERVAAVLLRALLPALGLQWGWCRNLATLDGQRLDGQGSVMRAPFYDMLEMIDDMEQGQVPPKVE
jgi:hypothetical protein